MDGTQEVGGCFVVARGDGPVLLEPGKEVLDHMPGLVQGVVISALLLVGAARGNYNRLASLAQGLDYPLVRVVGLVRNDRLCLARW